MANGWHVHLGIRLLGSVFKAEPLAAITKESFEMLRWRYRSRERWGNWLGFLWFIICAALLSFFYVKLAAFLSHDVQKTFFYGQESIMLVLAGCLVSLCISTTILFWAFRLWVGKEEYRLFMAYGGEHFRRTFGSRMDASKTFLAFFIVGIPLFGFGILVADEYTAFTDHGIVINPLWSLGTVNERPFTDVGGLYEVEAAHERSKDVFEPFQVIAFKDGERWESERRSQGPKLEQQRQGLRFVSQKAKVPVHIVSFEENIPADPGQGEKLPP